MNEISYIGKFCEKGESGLTAKGDFEALLFIAGGEIHSALGITLCNAGDVAVIPPLFKRRIVAPNAIALILDAALLPVKELTVIPFKRTEQLREIINFAAKSENKNARMQKNILTAYGNLIAALIAAYVAPDGYSPVVQSIIADAEKHVGDTTYSLEIFMRALPLNYDYIRKLFKKEVGVTPHEYLIRLRMQRAKAILLSGVTNRYSDYTVTQIAEACGFSEPLYFSRVFKKYFGIAPSFYIKENE